MLQVRVQKYHWFWFSRYVDSVYTDQLQGSTSTSDIEDSCDPLVYNGTLVLHPCGLIANTLFNDIITVESGQTLDETDIAWSSDVSDKVRHGCSADFDAHGQCSVIIEI